MERLVEILSACIKFNMKVLFWVLIVILGFGPWVAVAYLVWEWLA